MGLLKVKGKNKPPPQPPLKAMIPKRTNAQQKVGARKTKEEKLTSVDRLQGAFGSVCAGRWEYLPCTSNHGLVVNEGLGLKFLQPLMSKNL